MSKLLFWHISLSLLAFVPQNIQGHSFLWIANRDLPIYPGDGNKFYCFDDQARFKSLFWGIRFENGTTLNTISSEIMETKTSLKGDRVASLESVIRIPWFTNEILCTGIADDGKSVQASQEVELREFTPIESLKEPSCDSGPRSKIIMQRLSKSVGEGQYWRAHYVSNKEVEVPMVKSLFYPVGGLKLSCISKTKAVWQAENSFSNFTSWSSKENGCYVANLVLSPLSVDSGHQQKFFCKDESDKKSWVKFKFIQNTQILKDLKNPDAPFVIDYNQTEACVEHLGNTVFGSKTLGWTTAGSSVLSIAMMFGVVFLKRQLSQQRGLNGGSA